MDFIDFIGPSAWESFSLSYLILEKNFIPTGLSVGGTLPTADIVGKNFKTGRRIIAQCKMNTVTVDIDQDFIDLHDENDNTDYYYFAYGGCSAPASDHISVISRREIERWAQTENGRRYTQIFRDG